MVIFSNKEGWKHQWMKMYRQSLRKNSKQLLAMAKKKKNVLEYQEIVDFLAELALNEEQIEKVIEHLEKSGIDVLQNYE